MNRGRLIVVEGLEGAGKSTAMITLASVLKQNGLTVVTTREPGGTLLGEAVRELIKHTEESEPLDPRAELLLFYAARVQLIEYVIKPALLQGAWVLADRSELSSFAYQAGGRGLDEQMLHHLSAFCVGSAKPDLLFYLDISPEEGLNRAHQRGKLDRIEQEPIDFFYAVHAAYHRAIKSYPSLHIIDASQPLAVVQQDLTDALTHYLATSHVSS